MGAAVLLDIGMGTRDAYGAFFFFFSFILLLIFITGKQLLQ